MILYPHGYIRDGPPDCKALSDAPLVINRNQMTQPGPTGPLSELHTTKERKASGQCHTERPGHQLYHAYVLARQYS